MLNARNLFSVRGFAALALLLAPAFVAVQAADSNRAAPTFDLNAKMQKKLNAKLNGQLEAAEPTATPGLGDDLSSRVEEKSAEVNEQLDEQASALTSAQRGEETESDQQKAAVAAESTAAGTR